jgi:hypothetical protein
MAQFFFDRHNGSTTVEPFSELKYSTRDNYYKNAPAGCNPNMVAECDTQVYTLAVTDAQKQTMINNCLCKYKTNVDAYLQKNDSDMVINGTTNDNAEKYSNLAIKNINLGIGIGIMLIYMYSTNQ